MKKIIPIFALLASVVTVSSCVNAVNNKQVVEETIFTNKSVFKGNVAEQDEIPLYSLINSKKGKALYGTYPYSETIKGIKAEIPSGGTFVYNKILDTSKMDGSMPLIKIFPYATTQGFLDYGCLNIRLSDAYDLNNYFEIKLLDTGYGSYWVYERVKIPGEAEAAYVWATDSATGEVKKYVVKGRTGTEVRFDLAGTMQYMSGNSDDEKYQKCYNAFYFNYETKEIEVKTSLYHSKCKAYNQVIADLDDADMFTNPWNGFSTNQCILSISAASYAGGETAKILISSILDEVISLESFVDEDKPLIDVDFAGENEANLPIGVVNKSFKVFDYAAKDAQSGIKTSDVKVYKDYKEASQSETEIINNVFIPTSAGKYTIEYKATDNFDNETIKTVDVLVNETETPITFNIDTSKAVKKAFVGQEINVASASVAGGSGKVNLNTTVVCNETGDTYQLVKGKFTPKTEGTYVVMYVATDYLGAKKMEGYSISVTSFDGLVIEKDINLPKYLIEGFKYSLPLPTCKNYKTGTSGKPSINTIDANGENMIQDGKYTPSVANSGDSVTIKYYTTGTMMKEYSVPCYKVNATKENYFLKTNCISTASASSVALVSSSTSFEAEFINSLIADGNGVNFSIPEDQTFESVDFVITDSVNENEQIKVTFTKNEENNDKTFISVNNGLNYTTNFTFGGDGNLEFKYNQGTFVLSDNFDRNISITKYLNGKEFFGFTSGKVYLKIMINDCQPGDKILVNSINGSSMNNKAIATTFASIAVNGVYGGYYNRYDVVDVPNAVAGLVFDPCVSLKMSVINNIDDSYVVATDGTVLNNVDCSVDYSFIANQYTTYLVSYVAKDSKNRVSNWDYIVKSINFEKPSIEVRGTVPTTAAKGSSYTIPHADLSTSGKVYYFYETSEGDLYSTNEGNSIKFTAKGNYFIRFYGVDDIGNTTLLSFAIYVY